MKNQAQPMTGADIKGYRTLNEAEKKAMNDLKETSRYFIATLDQLPEILPEVDRRWLARARTAMQDACMFGCRAVSRPDDDC